jgi:hypothetical protein
MPVYFFNVRAGDDVHVDHTGHDLPDDMAAWQEATAHAESSIRNLDDWPRTRGSWRIDVIREDGRMLCSIEANVYGKI